MVKFLLQWPKLGEGGDSSEPLRAEAAAQAGGLSKVAEDENIFYGSGLFFQTRV
jgi:hypothetical protein